MSRGCLIDLTLCIGCRACQVACKQWNDLEAEKTEFFAGYGGYQNPPALSAQTYTLVAYSEVAHGGDLKWVFSKRQCMHCIEPSCHSACPVGAFSITPEGAVVYDEGKCFGCRYCMMACPFGIPTFEWAKVIPHIKKCTFCSDRQESEPPPNQLNDETMTAEQHSRHKESWGTPACAKACPTGCIKFGDREELVAEAKQRIQANPGKYVNHIYGEKEAGGTRWMYLSPVPFAALNFPMNVGERPYPSYTNAALGSVPILVVGGGAVLGGLYWLYKRKSEVGRSERKVS